MLLRTRRSRLDIPVSEPGSGIGGGFELGSVGRCEDPSVVPGVKSDGRIEPRYFSAFVGGLSLRISEQILVTSSQVDNTRKCSN
jgi:hypothetical protein